MDQDKQARVRGDYSAYRARSRIRHLPSVLSQFGASVLLVFHVGSFKDLLDVFD